MNSIIIVFVMVCCFLYSNIKYSKFSLEQNNTSEKFFSIIMFLALFVVLATQSTSEMNDVRAYKILYEEYADWSFERFFIECDKMKDPVYYCVGLIFSKLGFSFKTFKILINLFFIYSVAKVTLTYSSKVPLSIMVFISLGLYEFSYTGLRQVIAMSILLFAYKYMREKKLLKFIGIVLLATLFHSTAIIFLIAYFVYNLKRNLISIAIMLSGGIFVILNARKLVTFYLNYFQMDEYFNFLEKDNGLTISGVIIFTSIFIFTFIFTFSPKWKATDFKLNYLLFISVIFRILSTVWFAEFFRFSLYFSLFDGILIADACTTAKGEDKFLSRLKIFSVSFVLLVYHLLF